MSEESSHSLKTVFEYCLSHGVKLEDIHREYIRAALIHSKANKMAAARSLGLNVRTLQLKIKNYDMTQYSGRVRLP